jgi:hypothetical protein
MSPIPAVPDPARSLSEKGSGPARYGRPHLPCGCRICLLDLTPDSPCAKCKLLNQNQIDSIWFVDVVAVRFGNYLAICVRAIFFSAAIQLPYRVSCTTTLRTRLGPRSLTAPIISPALRAATNPLSRARRSVCLRAPMVFRASGHLSEQHAPTALQIPSRAARARLASLVAQARLPSSTKRRSCKAHVRSAHDPRLAADNFFLWQ